MSSGPIQPIQRLRGFKDLYGNEARVFAHFERVAREVFRSFDFEELRIPVLEEKSLFSRALGDQTDVVQKEMYEFVDRSEVQVAMRPEGTAGAARAYLENKVDKAEGHAKFFYMGAMFRSERPQAGRLRQFHQIGVEHLGTASPYADAETVLCIITYLDRLGIKGYKVKLNNLGTAEERKLLKAKLVESFEPKLKLFCEDCQKRFSRNVFRLLDCKVRECRSAVRQSATWIQPGAPLLSAEMAPESSAHFQQACDALKTVNAVFDIDPFMVRGLDYYTKTVFEVTHPDLGSQDALAAGGRYDNLIEMFGGEPAGAVGFALGMERLAMCAAFAPNPDKPKPVFIAALGEDAFRLGFVLINALRRLSIPATMETKVRSLKSQLRVAEKKGCRYVVLLGDEEIQRKVFVLKDMNQSGEEGQVEYDLNALMDRFLELYRTEYLPMQLAPDFLSAAPEARQAAQETKE